MRFKSNFMSFQILTVPLLINLRTSPPNDQYLPQVQEY